MSSPGGQKDPGAEAAAPDIKIDWEAQLFSRNLTYLVDWSLGMKVTPATLKSLRPEVYAVIDKEVTAHIEEMEQEKKALSGELGPRAISA